MTYEELLSQLESLIKPGRTVRSSEIKEFFKKTWKEMQAKIMSSENVRAIIDAHQADANAHYEARGFLFDYGVVFGLAPSIGVVSYGEGVDFTEGIYLAQNGKMILGMDLRQGFGEQLPGDYTIYLTREGGLNCILNGEAGEFALCRVYWDGEKLSNLRDERKWWFWEKKRIEKLEEIGSGGPVNLDEHNADLDAHYIQRSYFFDYGILKGFDPSFITEGGYGYGYGYGGKNVGIKFSDGIYLRPDGKIAPGLGELMSLNFKDLLPPEIEILLREDFSGDLSNFSYIYNSVIENGELRGGPGDNIAIVKNGLGWNDYTVEADIRLPEPEPYPGPSHSNRGGGIWFRMPIDNTENVNFGGFIFGFENDDKLALRKLQSGNFSLLLKDSMTHMPEHYYHLKVEINGTNAKCYFGEELVFDYNGIDIAQGTVGLGIINGNSKEAYFDNLKIYHTKLFPLQGTVIFNSDIYIAKGVSRDWKGETEPTSWLKLATGELIDSARPEGWNGEGILGWFNWNGIEVIEYLDRRKFWLLPKKRIEGLEDLQRRIEILEGKVG